MSLVGISTLILLISGGIIQDALYSTLKVHGDYWIWGVILIPLIFVILGFYYSSIGLKQKETNNLILTSVIFQLVALIIGTFGLIYPKFNHVEFGYVITILLGIPAIILMIIGIILMFIGQKKLKEQNHIVL